MKSHRHKCANLVGASETKTKIQGIQIITNGTIPGEHATNENGCYRKNND